MNTAQASCTVGNQIVQVVLSRLLLKHRNNFVKAIFAVMISNVPKFPSVPDVPFVRHQM